MKQREWRGILLCSGVFTQGRRKGLRAKGFAWDWPQANETHAEGEAEEALG